MQGGRVAIVALCLFSVSDVVFTAQEILMLDRAFRAMSREGNEQRLLMAVESGNITVIQEILDKNPSLLTTRDKNNRTLLMQAIEGPSSAIVKLLLLEYKAKAHDVIKVFHDPILNQTFRNLPLIHYAILRAKSPQIAAATIDYLNRSGANLRAVDAAGHDMAFFAKLKWGAAEADYFFNAMLPGRGISF